MRWTAPGETIVEYCANTVSASYKFALALGFLLIDILFSHYENEACFHNPGLPHIDGAECVSVERRQRNGPVGKPIGSTPGSDDANAASLR